MINENVPEVGKFKSKFICLVKMEFRWPRNERTSSIIDREFDKNWPLLFGRLVNILAVPDTNPLFSFHCDILTSESGKRFPK